MEANNNVQNETTFRRFRVALSAAYPRFGLRVHFLRFCQRQGVILEAISCIVFTMLTGLSFALEMNKSCKPDIKLWLSVMTARSILRTLLRIYIACCERNMLAIGGGNIHTATKVVEMLDVFGLVWFAVGNLLVFNGTGCSKAIPFVYFVCISYIGVAYLSLVLPVVVRFSLVIYPPFGGDINLNADIPDPNQTVAGNTALSVNVTDQQADFWKRWLEERHCVEHIFDRLKDIPNFESGVHNDGNTTKCTGGNDGNTTTCMGGNDGNTTTYMGSSTDVDVEAGEAQAQVQGQSSDNYIEVANAGLWDNCPICLVDFDCTIEDAMSSAVAAPESSAVDDDGNVVHPGLDPQQHQLVVNFPCRGKHLFHVKCLHSWLNVASGRANRNAAAVTCPCCRESPAATSAPRPSPPSLLAIHNFNPNPNPNPNPSVTASTDQRLAQQQHQEVNMTATSTSASTSASTSNHREPVGEGDQDIDATQGGRAQHPRSEEAVVAGNVGDAQAEAQAEVMDENERGSGGVRGGNRGGSSSDPLHHNNDTATVTGMVHMDVEATRPISVLSNSGGGRDDSRYAVVRTSEVEVDVAVP